MYSFECPNCDQPITATAAKAGGETVCGACGDTVAVPKLGVLRQSATASGTPSTSGRGTASSGGSALPFVVAAVIATVAGLTSAFCGVRYALIQPPMDTEGHLERLAAAYETENAAVLIREYEIMTKYDLDLGGPMQYRVDANLKAEWGLNALIAGGIALAAGLGAFIAAPRRPGESPDGSP